MIQDKGKIQLTNWEIVSVNPNDKLWDWKNLFCFWGVSIPFLHDNSPLAIGVCIAIIIVASLTLLLDFDMIEKNSKSGAPKEFEWLGAMALLVTIIWLYLEFLRLLSKLQD